MGNTVDHAATLNGDCLQGGRLNEMLTGGGDFVCHIHSSSQTCPERAVTGCFAGLHFRSWRLAR